MKATNSVFVNTTKFVLFCRWPAIEMSAEKPVPAPESHINCLTPTYIRDETVARFPVPRDKIKWTVAYEDYDPIDFTMPHILKGPVWADPNIRYISMSKLAETYSSIHPCRRFIHLLRL